MKSIAISKVCGATAPSAATAEITGKNEDKNGAAYVCMQLLRRHVVNNWLIRLVNSLFIFSYQTTAMDPTRIALFDLAQKRLTWTAQRQSVLATNIANANTPGFQGRDIKSFESILSGTGSIGATKTQPGHLSGTVPTGLASLITDPPTARSLDGNTVALDQQLTKVANTETTQSLVTTIWKKYMGMFSTALGRSS